MRLSLLALAAGLLLGFAVSSRGQEAEPRAILERAVKAHGETPEFARQCQAFRQKIKGTYFMTVDMPFTADSWEQADGAYKFTMLGKLGDDPIDVTMVFNGTRAWMQTQGFTQDLSEPDLNEMKQRARMRWMYSPVELLQEKNVTLTSLGESKVEGEAVLGIQVKSKGLPDANLFFSRASGLLVKTQHRGKAVLEESVLKDYREWDCALAEEQVLRAAGRPSDGPALLAFVRNQTLSAGDRDRIQALIRQLSDDAFEVREKASASLVAEEARAVPFLRLASKDVDLEVARRAQQCLSAIEARSGTKVLAAAIHLIAIRQPAGAAEVLLAYLPGAADEGVAREVRAVLAAIALRDGKPDPALLQALEDADPRRRAAALAALGRDGGAFQKQPGRRLYPVGIKYPRKYDMYHDGKKISEHEVLAIEFFNQFPANTFAQPR